MKNYKKVNSKYIEEIQSEVTIYQHQKTGARVCTIANDDHNKVFSIAFRTPPIDSTGLTHILEHSVLCGSKNYPVKDPFVELLKSSLNTFLNAFTFPDKTMYPCASQNDKDFKNLMSVYMDAVFYPRIYQFEEIFMQEGWHYHLENAEDPITYNGVVYNEMKGAFSNPQEVLSRTIMHSLYPNTPYGFESGGDPKYIPELTYESFLNFHSKFYHPSNSFIFVYGDCDMEERLDWLDQAYLSNFDKIDFDTTIPAQQDFVEPKYEQAFYPLAKEEPLENKTFLSYNVSFPTTLDSKLMIATTLLVKALLINPGAPLKQALIDANLGQDIRAMFEDGILQPLLSIMVINSDADKEEAFIQLVEEKLQEIVKEGIHQETLMSLINFAEFKTREAQFSPYMPKGVEIQMDCLSSWLYSEDQPFAKLEKLAIFKELKEDMKHGYFEDIITKYILNNKHKSFVKMVPSYTVAEEKEAQLTKKLADYKESLSQDEILALVDKNKKLQEYQSAASTAEEIATLPKLKIEDISPLPEKYNCEKLEGVYPTLYSEYFTNGISYVKYSFDISHLPLKCISYVKLLSELLSQLSTDRYSFQEINRLVQQNTGGLQINVSPIMTVENECKNYFTIGFSSVDENITFASDLISNILTATNLADEKRLYERLCELKATQEMGIVHSGHAVSLFRSASYFSEYAATLDAISGVGYLDFICDVCGNFQEKKKEMIDTLTALTKKLFTKQNFLLRYTGQPESLSKARPIVDVFYNQLVDHAERCFVAFEPKILNEGIKTQFNVNFVARTGCFKQPYHGAMAVLKNALSLDYLWVQLRVHGGAYGAMIDIFDTGILMLASYRDPHIQRTNKVYEEIVEYIEKFNPSEEDLLKYKIGAIGGLESVLHASMKGAMAQEQMLRGVTYELRTKERTEILEATKEQIVAFAPLFKEALSEKHLCVIGNANKVEEEKELFDTIRNLTN